MSPKTCVPHSVRSVFLLVAIVVVCATSLFATPGSIVISQVYGGGGNKDATYKNDFVELFNRSTVPVNVEGWTVQYASYSGTSWSKTPLSGVIQPGHYYLVQEAKGSGGTVDLPSPDVKDTLSLSATAGKVALVNNSTQLTGSCPTAGVVDFVGFGNGTNCYEGAGPTAAPSNTTAVLRVGGGYTDTDNNAADFTTGAPNPRNSGQLRASAKATPTSGEAGDHTLIEVTVTPAIDPPSTGITVTADLRPLGGTSAEPLHDDGANGDKAAGDRVYSFLAEVDTTSVGAKTLNVTVNDEQGSSATATITFTVDPAAAPYAIHDIQGSGWSSPHVGEYVMTTGIVTALKANGFFLQAPKLEYDDDPATSEGIFVFSSTVPAEAAVGNGVEVRGTVSEYHGLTEIGLKRAAKLTEGNTLPAPVKLTTTELNPSGAVLERFEGMRVEADLLTAVGPTDGNYSDATGTATTNGEFFAVLSGTARPFREPGAEAGTTLPAGAPANIPVFDGNPERILVDTNALVGATALDITSNTVLTNAIGVLDYSDYNDGSYTLELDPSVPAIVSGGMSAAIPLPAPGTREFTVGSFNMLHFYNTGISTQGYALRLGKASKAIREVMRMPDIIGVEEVKDLTVLQDIAAKVNADAADAGQGDPGYTAYLMEGNDPSHINVGFLVRSRVQVVSVDQVGKDATFDDPRPSRKGTTQLINDRPPLVLKAKLTPPVGQPYPVTVIVNHMRSLIDVGDTGETGMFVRGKRQACAEFLAGLIQQHLAAGQNVISVGDYNAFEFNDGYVDVLGTVKGTPTPADQVLLASEDLVDPDMVDLVLTLPAEKRYTYVENGNAQTLDHVLASPGVLANGYHLEIAHNNADFPQTWHNTTGPERVSDHDMPVGYFTFPPPKADLAVSATAEFTTVLSGHGQSFTVTVTNNGPDAAENVTFAHAIPEHMTFTSLTAPAGWTCTTPSAGSRGNVSCQAASLAAGSSAEFTVDLGVNCATADATAILSAFGATSDTVDPQSGNNTASVTTTVSNPAPVISGLSVDKLSLGPPNHKLIPVTLTYTATDNCDVLAPEVSVSSNQPLNGTGDGNTEFDWVVVDANHVLLRAERAPTSTAGRTYTVTVTVQDAMGGKTSNAVQVSVAR